MGFRSAPSTHMQRESQRKSQGEVSREGEREGGREGGRERHNGEAKPAGPSSALTHSHTLHPSLPPSLSRTHRLAKLDLQFASSMVQLYTQVCVFVCVFVRVRVRVRVLCVRVLCVCERESERERVCVLCVASCVYVCASLGESEQASV